mgnify:CR=1 FL=1
MNENLNRKDLELAIQKTRDSFDTDKPVIPFIEGDGIGIDIWPASQRVFDAAVEKAYSNERKIEWQEVLAGQKAFDNTSEWLPEKTIEMFDEFGIGIKGPLTTPVGEGIRSINVAIRQKLDLYACLRPLRWFEGVETPTKNPGNVDIALFRENTEDVYSGKELEMNSDDVVKLNKFLKEEFNWEIRSDSGIGIKPISKTASERLIRTALNYAVENNKKNLAIVHKGNIMKFTEGGFKNWGYELAESKFKYLKLSNIYCKHADGGLGWNEQSPFDRIIVTASAPEIPNALINQLSDNGIMLIPLGDENNDQTLIKVTKDKKSIKTENLFNVRFVPLLEGKMNK